MSKSCISFGCQGDIITSFGCLSQTGGKYRYYVKDSIFTKIITTPERFNPIRELALSQPYIESFEIHSGEPIDLDFGNFRPTRKWGKNLAQIQADFANLPYDQTKPWLTVEPMDLSDRILVNKTHRWDSQYFNWKAMAEFYGDHLLFIGLPDEHKDFEVIVGRKMDYLPTVSLLDAARAIAGSFLFVGNQSSCMAIACGLGVRFIQAVCHYIPDCIYKGRDAQYVTDGAMTLHHPDGRTAYVPATQLKRSLDRNMVPPGGWTLTINGNTMAGQTFRMLAKNVSAFLVANGGQSVTPDDVEAMVLEQNQGIGHEKWHDTIRKQQREIEELAK